METKEYNIISAGERIALIQEAKRTLVEALKNDPDIKKPSLSDAYIGLEKALQDAIMAEAKALASTSE